MNLPLLESWLDPYPQLVDFSIPDTHVTSILFNRRGTHLAGACANGAVVIWDLDTMAILRALHGHAAAVESMSWSYSGRYLVTGGQDWRVIVWDLSTSKEIAAFDFDAPVTNVAVHPFNRHLVLVGVQKSPPVLVNVQTGQRTVISEALPPPPSAKPAADGTPQPEQPSTAAGEAPGPELDVLTAWDPTGRYIFAGTSKGNWQVVEADTLRRIFTDRLAGSAIRHFAFSRSGQHLAITVGDKSIRTYHLPYVAEDARRVAKAAAAAASAPDSAKGSPTTPDSPPSPNPPPFECVPVLKLQDLVNRHSWCSSALSANEEYVIGATSGRAHCINIWSRVTGALVKLLEGPSESLISFAWHPVLPLCVTLSHRGTLYVWNTTPKEKWSAFAPDFKEIEDNIEYQEREDEFDVVDEEAAGDGSGMAAGAGGATDSGGMSGARADGGNGAPARESVVDVLSTRPPLPSAAYLMRSHAAPGAALAEHAPAALAASSDREPDEDPCVIAVPLDSSPTDVIVTAQPLTNLVAVQRSDQAGRGKRKRDD